jgi:SAM-dependent methyltransferase
MIQKGLFIGSNFNHALPVQSVSQPSPLAAQKDFIKKKITAGFVVKSIAGRLFLPRNWSPFLRCFRSRNNVSKAADDATLKLYGQILPGGFLNYGYSEDPTIPPEKMNIAGVQEAQIRYGQRLVDLVIDKQNRVLDAGCGMGGLVGLLLKRGLQPTALTPNRTQIRRVREDFPNVPMIEGKLEEIPLPEFRHTFGTVITSESFQYMKLPVALDVIDQVLKPGGRWILCDYFRTSAEARKSGHLWGDFTAALDQRGWRIVSQQDITANVLPTIAFAHMFGKRFGLPVAQYVTERLERKRPALHFLLQDVIGELRGQMQRQLDIVDPAIFAREKKYVTLVIERK